MEQHVKDFRLRIRRSRPEVYPDFAMFTAISHALNWEMVRRGCDVSEHAHDPDAGVRLACGGRDVREDKALVLEQLADRGSAFVVPEDTAAAIYGAVTLFGERIGIAVDSTVILEGMANVIENAKGPTHETFTERLPSDARCRLGELVNEMIRDVGDELNSAAARRPA